jgi:hypothetical protein
MIFNLINLSGFFIFACASFFLYLTIREESFEAGENELDRTQPFRCPICAYIYVVGKEEEFSSCPRCGTINKKNTRDSYKR